jgi:hypothetical protein
VTASVVVGEVEDRERLNFNPQSNLAQKARALESKHSIYKLLNEKLSNYVFIPDFCIKKVYFLPLQ